jgi:hypothetical protein
MDDECARQIDGYLKLYTQVTPWLIVGMLGARVITAEESRQLIRRIFIDKDWPPGGATPSGGGGVLGGGGESGGGASEFVVSDWSLGALVLTLAASVLVAHSLRRNTASNPA